ncbi:MAG: hypothetical protein MHM6MM_003701 [Cercozoa sp. M6MM]
MLGELLVFGSTLSGRFAAAGGSAAPSLRRCDAGSTGATPVGTAAVLLFWPVVRNERELVSHRCMCVCACVVCRQQSLQEAGEDTTGYLQRTYGPESEYVRSLDETKQRQQQRDHRAYQARSQYGQYPPQQQGQYQRHPPQGYQQQGYPLQGYPPQSYPPQSCPPQGYQQRQQQPPMYQLQQQQQASGYQPQHPHYQQQQPQQRGYQGHSGHYAQHYGDRRQQRPY